MGRDVRETSALRMTPLSFRSSRYARRMFKQVGFFHFAKNYQDPIGSLKNALSRHDDVRDSLIVLPEAFNNGRSYYDQPLMQPEFTCAEMVHELTRIGAGVGTAFVAGLLAPPQSSAYFIDRNGASLLRHKMCDDHSGQYTPCETNCNFQNPFEKEGAYLGTLICNDIERHAQGMAAKLDQRGDIRKVVCLPGCMGSQWFGSGPLTLDHWKGKYLILANSNAYGCGSFISNQMSEREIFTGEQNEVVL